ncbi:3-isopropylmalate dehydratase large subunit [Liquorilactobacillus satsumensis]|uniref:3-isopropylmalate dehydratase large subunit n=1 Tax=Liquorilactobacillus satsumensis DSM 16230 = JCM 12392 TaxID=1423801 RepID=A0A0R1V569_9LACO|nr:3-isopropylmalate dehydratase large subunit [Liquorilactobacillus satsumensis]KRL96827.1 3-isopropylmalate dehydratase, large subunit [Liquorilactobacillus satsumensis DSM 16230 = JCM 12392]MCC7666433.1 3-isopropylmalate dehydratase large subunit [Liquorilactobacillus satsumensis]MCP9312987.1 3-isopropylmalate dehydratase large subunit [Liquorilactobacillus satsumensis]MCP9328933.1 3-isopropylmalate dehydratase large subunit [Liquorilactobacillus satsumensis]MCP9357642.1 3-isopropylmalate d
MKQTMFDKLWDRHVISGEPGGPQLIYVDLHLVHEVTSPQAFEGLRENGRQVRRTDKTFATMDHNVPTTDIFNVKDAISRKQIETLARNAKEFGIRLAGMGHADQGIIHVIGPQLGLTQPGMVVVCGDSHTATHGAFGSIAFGIGTSEVEHVLATQTIWQTKPKTMGIHVHGRLPHGVYAKDIIMGIIAREGVAFGTGYAVELYGDTIENMSMEERMTLCNMGIEGGAKMCNVKPDQTTFDYVAGRKYAPKNMKRAIADWKQYYTDSPEAFDKVIDFDVHKLAPFVSWGTNPGMSVPVDEKLPEIKNADDQKAFDYVGLRPGQPVLDIPIQYAFFGSCTNGRLSDLKIAANVLKGHHIAAGVTALVVPGSRAVKEAAEKMGIDQIFKNAGCEWREPGCSACLGMNPDQVPAGLHCASTSNRNFEGRQGAGSRTHLASPAMVAYAAINGHFVDIRKEEV